MSRNVRLPENFNDLSPEAITQLLEIHKQKALNEAKKLHLKEKQLDYGAKYSEKIVDSQVLIMNQRPIEIRKTFTKIGWVISMFVIVILAFLTVWIWMGRDEFAIKFLQGAGYLLTTAIGYWLGAKNRTKNVEKNESNFTEAEIVE